MAKRKDTPPKKVKKYVAPTPKPIPIPVVQNWQCRFGCGAGFVSPKGASSHEGNCKRNPANNT